MEEEVQRDQAHQAPKLTPLQLRERYHLNIADLAWRAKVGPGTVYFMLLGYPIRRKDAELILATISELSGESYTLENVEVALVPAHEEQAKPGESTPPSDEQNTPEEADRQ